MRRNWSYSLTMLLVYVALFVFWKYFPSRASFVAAGMLAIAVLGIGLVRAYRAAYFVNRVDLCLHAYVIVDLCLETASFEAFRAIQPFAVVRQFHNNNNFIGCTVVLTLLVGGYRWYALRKQNAVADGAHCGQVSL